MSVPRKTPRKRALLWAGSLGTAAIVAAMTVTLRSVPREVLQQRARQLPAPLDSTESLFERATPRVPIKNAAVRKIVAAAHTQEGDDYDASYRQISYPNGDVPKGSGACTDVVVRALRGAGVDLQSLVHDDMVSHFKLYSDRWRLGHPDSNIDHRRVPNLMVFFERYGQSLPIDTSGPAAKSWRPGDIVCWRLEGGRWHIGLVSDGIGPRGLPLVIHNGWVCVEQDCLDTWKIAGHYRFPRQ